MDSLFTKIKAVVTPLQAAEHYGLSVKRGGMTCCVFHNDRHPSMKLYPDHYYCFGCHASGDVANRRVRGFHGISAAIRLPSTTFDGYQKV